MEENKQEKKEHKSTKAIGNNTLTERERERGNMQYMKQFRRLRFMTMTDHPNEH